MRKIDFLKTMDKFGGGLYCLFVREPFQATSTKFPLKSVLFIRPGGIGDAVFLLPTINALKMAYPGCTIDILAEWRNAAAFHLISDIRSVYLYDTLSGLPSVLSGRYDVVIDTEQWHRLSAVVARLTKARTVIGYGSNERKKLFTHPVSYSLEEYEVDSFYNLLAPLGISKPTEVGTQYLDISGDAAAKAEQILGALVDRPFVVIFPGASIAEKRWSVENFCKLAAILQERGIPVVVIGARSDVAAGERIIAEECGLNLAGKTTLAESAAIIARGRVLVSGDSGILHIGYGLGKPTVSLFGPSNIKKWAPRGNCHMVISKNLPCSPCSQFGYTPKCPIGAKCMAEISVDEVAEAVEWLMEKSA